MPTKNAGDTTVGGTTTSTETTTTTTTRTTGTTNTGAMMTGNSDRDDDKNDSGKDGDDDKNDDRNDDQGYKSKDGNIVVNANLNAKFYTMTDIQAHSDANSCRTTVNGSVYDVTVWINQHPGGKNAILSLCGKDGSEAFGNKHGGQTRPESELA